MDKQKLVVITGPTAVGKTKLSIELAKQIGGEIISADSMQVYKFMNIGTDKISPDKMDGVPHHLIDFLDPHEDFNVFSFQKLVKEAIADIASRGKVPIIVGGTGFYIQSVLYDIDFTEMEEEPAYRKELQKIAAEKGPEYLHAMLESVDPASAQAIHPNNIKRVIRALEFHKESGGSRISDHNKEQRERESAYDALFFVLTMDRKALYERIDQRVDRMMEKGLVEEVKGLREMGLTSSDVSMQGLGYKEILKALEGEMSLEEAVYVIKRDTRHFAKRQLSWFRREKDVRWICMDRYPDRKAAIDRMEKTIREEWNIL